MSFGPRAPRLRSDAPEDHHTVLMRSRPCTPCLKRGLRVAAHRILPNGEGRCDACYRAKAAN